MSPKNYRGAVACGVLLSFCAPKSLADLWVYEGFRYEGDTLEGQGGGVGFAGAWERRYSGKADPTLVEGLTFSDYPVAGRAACARSGESGSGSVSDIRLLSGNFPAAPAPVWSSHLVSYTIEQGAKATFYGGLATCNNSFPDDFRFGISALDGSQKFRAVYQSPGEKNSTSLSHGDTTYLMIGKYEGGVGVTLWALSAANYDAIKGNGISEEELDATNSGKVVDRFEDGEGDSLQEYLAIGSAVFGENAVIRITYDELKLGSTLADVLAPPPETEK